MRLLAAVVAALALPLVTAGDGPAAVAASRIDYVMPVLQASSPGPGVVDLSWTGLYEDPVIVWQCTPAHGCFDTLRPNTGSLELTAPTGTDRYQVCEPAQPYDLCTNPVAVVVQ